MSTLLLRLAGPLQAWGTESRFNTRQTGALPSKSGVIGLLAAALGLRRDAELSRLRELRFGVRTDYPGELLRDFHVTQYTTKKGQKTSTVSERFYLSDAVFLAAFESDDTAFLEELEAALRAPVWPLFLGRRSCPPTLPFVLGIRELPLDEALRNEPWQLSAWGQEQWRRKHYGQTPRLPVMTDADGSGYGRTIVQDDPISFDQRSRIHGFRTIEGKKPMEVTEKEKDAVPFPTEHDAFAEVEGS